MEGRKAVAEVPPLAEILEERLRLCESGKVDKWWLVAEVLCSTVDGAVFHWFAHNVCQLTVWASASAHTRSRIIITARQFLSSDEPSREDWFGTNTVFYPAVAGYHAFVLLMHEAPAVFAEIPLQLWEKWAPTIVSFPASTGVDEFNGHQLITAHLYANAPEKVLSLYLKLMEVMNGPAIFTQWAVGKCWDERFIVAVLGRLRVGGLRPEASLRLTEELIHYGGSRSLEIVEKELVLPIPAEEAARKRCHAIGNALIEYNPKDGWPILWRAITSDAAWGRDLFLHAGYRLDRHSGGFSGALTEPEVADLYDWMVHQFPPHEDPQNHSEQMHRIGPREMVADFRDGLLRGLTDRGTPESIDSIKSLVDRLPSMTHLRSLLFSSRQVTMQRTWQPPTPHELLSLLQHPRSRLVQNADQLLGLVIESVQRLEARLQGTPPIAYQLWDQFPFNRPKDEERISDAIADHLKEDLEGRGVAVKREVQIRPSLRGAGKGERTDIQVDATLVGNHSAQDVVSITIEVKGCWHRELMTAAETQLSRRYLADTSTHHGLYLVGWFRCSAWNDPADRRRDRTPSMAMGELQKFLDDAASRVSAGPKKVRAMVLNASLR